MKRNRVILAVAVLAVTLFGIGTGWTVAWLTSESKSVKNVFTVGYVQVQLTETFNTDKDGDGNLDIWKGIVVPGTELNKNPHVIIPDGCEDSWIFVKLQKTDWPAESLYGSKISYAIEDGWQFLPDNPNICFREVDREESARIFQILKQDQILVSETLTKQEMDSLGQPKLTVTAYAIQRAGFDSPAEAWKQICPTA